jgi:isopenicillin N synthase-like dioxygenase
VLSTGKAAESGNVDDTLMAPPDIKEMFAIGPKDPKAGFPDRIFPAKPEDFEATWTAYYDAVNNLAGHILAAFAMGLELPDNFFDQYIDRHASALRAINYPAIATRADVLPGQCRASSHTDYGTITILRTDGPGLQVSKDVDCPVWHDVPHIENGFVINLGDLMRRWTNDRWLSTLHRVIVPATDVQPSDDAKEHLVCRRRQSMAFFHNINRDAVVTTLLREPNEVSKHEPIVAGDFLLQKHLASVGVKARK